MHSTRRFLWGGVVLALTAATSAQAQLTVIADHGGQPARPYYARAEARTRGPVTEADMLPVTSDRLTLGHVTARSLDLPGRMTPFFIVGADKLSVRWLKQRGDRLRHLHAVGLVVNVKTAAQLKQLRRIGDGLVLRPVAGDDIATRLELSHYPVLVTPKGVQQ